MPNARKPPSVVKRVRLPAREKPAPNASKASAVKSGETFTVPLKKSAAERSKGKGGRTYAPTTLRRQERQKEAQPARLIAYDFETTRIRQGTPRPLYLTAYGFDFAHAGPIHDMTHLFALLQTHFLTEEFQGFKFVAWNANNFDAYFVAAALLESDDYVLRPYLTKGNGLRGLRVIVKGDEEFEPQSQRHWEFLDGMAMLGLAGVSLAKFLKTFTPDHLKIENAINFETEEFDFRNPAHCEYAMRDSVGLWHGMQRAQAIMLERFNQPLTVTMGNACIKIFKAHIPRDTKIQKLPDDALTITRDYVMRGGFCFCVGRYHGPVWKYDINQAYAAAMREATLPAGKAMHCTSGLQETEFPYIALVKATNLKNKIPFYYRTHDRGYPRARFATTHIELTWITSIELEQLRFEGWEIEVFESYTWTDKFDMREYVDKLETVRTTCEGGPNGAIGTVIKAVGNHSYGV